MNGLHVISPPLALLRFSVLQGFNKYFQFLEFSVYRLYVHTEYWQLFICTSSISECFFSSSTSKYSEAGICMISLVSMSRMVIELLCSIPPKFNKIISDSSVVTEYVC